MKNKRQFKSVKARLIFWFLVVALLPLLIVSGVISYQRANAIKAFEFNKLTAIRDLKVDQVNHWLDERIGDIQTISQDYEIRALEERFHKGEQPQNRTNVFLTAEGLLNRYIENYKTYDELFIINPDTGKIIISTNKALMGEERSHDPYFTEPMRTRKAYIKDIYYSQTLKKPAMALSIPIFCATHGEHIVGILVARVNLEYSLFDLLLDRTGMGKTGETLIVNKDVFALNELRWYERAPLKLKIRAEPALLAAMGKTGIVEATDYRGEEVLAAYTYIPRTQWGFVAKQDLREVYAPIRSMLRNILILFAISAGIVYGLAFFLASAIAHPVNEMTEVSRKIETGDLSARNRVTSEDELGFLAESFNAMAESIESQMELREINDKITQTLVGAKDLPTFRTNILKKLVEVTGSQMGAYFVLNRDTNIFEHFTSIGITPGLLKPFNASTLEGEVGMVVETKKITHIKDIPEDSIFTFRTFPGTVLPKEIISIPIIIDNVVSGIVSLASIKPYPRKVLDIMEQPWTTGFGTALSNMKANDETKRLAEELEGKNRELQAQAEELQSQSEELQEQNVELEAQREQVEEANRLKSEFLSNMSHELRTPLNSVMALSRVLLMQAKEKLSEEELNYLEIIHRNGQNLLSLINDILDLSKIEAGKMDVTPKLFSIASTIETIMERLDPVAEEKGIAINQEVPDNLPRIESDEARVHQILQNLVGNGLKFTDRGSVTVSARCDEQKVYIRVADTGIGISAKNLSHIFQEFRQVDGTSARPYEGTGLGLAIAHGAARMLGGELTVQSAPGKGSTFTLILPVKWSGLIPDAGPFAVSKPAQITPAQKTVLVVDDNEIERKEMASIIEEEGMKALVAEDGGKCMDMIQESLPDVLVLDLIMPDVDGFEVLDKVRSDPVTRNLPVIVVTAKDLSTEERENLSGNISSVLTKSDTTSKTLLEELKKLLSEIERPPEYLQAEKVAPGNRILLVEDNPDNMTTIKAILKGSFNLLEATDGEKGLRTVLEEKPDLVLLDMSLPKMDGFEVARRMKSERGGHHIPVIALTAHAMKGDREKTIEAGCDNYVSKPVDPEKLLETIENHLRK